MLKLDYHDDFLVEKETFCALPFTKLILNSWGEVSMCCHQLTQLGKLDESTEVLDIWRNAVSEEVRSKTDDGELHPVCTSWNSCPFIVKERTMYKRHMYKRHTYPVYLEICLPDKHCNVGGENPGPDNPACIMCRRNFHIPDQPDLTEFLSVKAKPLMPYLRQLCVLGIAEPFWKDAVFKVFDIVEFDRYRHRIQFTTNTNGICLNEKVARKFFDSVSHSDLSWSLDSASPETHMKIRRLDAFDHVVSNLRRWLKMREEYGGKKAHQVCIYNNINLLNVHEMTKMVELAHEWGVDNMVMLPTYDQSGVVELGEIMLSEKNVKVFKRASEQARAKADELGVKLHYSKRFDVVPPPMPRPEPEQLIQLRLPN